MFHPFLPQDFLKKVWLGFEGTRSGQERSLVRDVETEEIATWCNHRPLAFVAFCQPATSMRIEDHSKFVQAIGDGFHVHVLEDPEQGCDPCIGLPVRVTV